jgi:hypothetical protein
LVVDDLYKNGNTEGGGGIYILQTTMEVGGIGQQYEIMGAENRQVSFFGSQAIRHNKHNSTL